MRHQSLPRLKWGAYRLRAHVMFSVGTGLLLFSIGTVPSMARSNNKEGQSGVASVYSTSSGSGKQNQHWRTAESWSAHRRSSVVAVWNEGARDEQDQRPLGRC